MARGKAAPGRSPAVSSTDPAPAAAGNVPPAAAEPSSRPRRVSAARRGASSRPSTSSPAIAAGDVGAGFVLALIAWGWVGLPLITGGPDKVRAVLKAKFFNKAVNGAWLP